jgi:hypothetical protein
MPSIGIDIAGIDIGGIDMGGIDMGGIAVVVGSDGAVVGAGGGVHEFRTPRSATVNNSPRTGRAT